MKRETPEDDIDRLTERINNSDPNIDDNESFNAAYDNYLGEGMSPTQDNKLRKKVKTKLFFNKAGGKNLKQDKRKRAKIVTDDPKRYIKTGSQRLDLEGVDTPKVSSRKRRNELRRQKTIRRQKDFTYPHLGRVKNKRVYARKIITKSGSRFIDRGGHYVRVSRKKTSR